MCVYIYILSEDFFPSRLPSLVRILSISEGDRESDPTDRVRGYPGTMPQNDRGTRKPKLADFNVHAACGAAEGVLM